MNDKVLQLLLLIYQQTQMAHPEPEILFQVYPNTSKSLWYLSNSLSMIPLLTALNCSCSPEEFSLTWFCGIYKLL